MSLVISVESIDGAGKSTQVQMLIDHYEKMGKKVYIEHFPRTDKPIGKLISSMLESKVNMVDPMAFQMLYISDQIDYQKELKLHEDEDCVIILDRYDLSSIVYGISTTNSSFHGMYSLQTKITKPHVTIILDIDVDTANERMGKDKDSHESNIVLQDKCRFNYMSLFYISETGNEFFKDRKVILIKTDDKSIKEVHEEIIDSMMDCN